jgi:hypothetical protein
MLETAVGKTRIVMRGSNRPELFRFADGSILVEAFGPDGHRPAILSTDAGERWQPYEPPAPLGSDGEMLQLDDGTVLSLAYHALPLPDRPGWFELPVRESDDNWKTVRGPVDAPTHVAGAAPGYDDGGNLTGRLYLHGNTVEIPNGNLLATAYGYFAGDLRPGETAGRIGNLRSFVIRSTDRGKSWSYLSTIASVGMVEDPKWKQHLHEGFGEPTMVRCPDGSLLCVMRVGTYVGTGPASDTYHDLSNTIIKDGKYLGPGAASTSPLYQSVSLDEGKTWSQPTPMEKACGACPRLLLLRNGVLALGYGRVRRPSQDNYIIFSADCGRTWTHETAIFEGISSGYCGMVETDPGRILYVFDSVTAWGPTFAPDWVGAVDIAVDIEVESR